LVRKCGDYVMTKPLLLTLASAMLIAIPVASFAGVPEGAGAPRAPVSEPKAAVDQKKYCIIEATTGSRIAKKKCQTRAEWLLVGVDPTEKQ